MICFNMLFKLKLRGVLKELPLTSDNLLLNQLNGLEGFKMNFKRICKMQTPRSNYWLKIEPNLNSAKNYNNIRQKRIVLYTILRYNIIVVEIRSRDLVNNTTAFRKFTFEPERRWYRWKQKYSGKRGSLVIALTIYQLSVAAINFAIAYAIIKKANRK